jgi:hypothetical protein
VNEIHFQEVEGTKGGIDVISADLNSRLSLVDNMKKEKKFRIKKNISKISNLVIILIFIVFA